MTTVTLPTAATLKKYGFNADDFWTLWRQQGEKCPICEKVPTTGRVVFDHYHVKGWKAMNSAMRAAYVRGLTCWYCNHAYLGRGITAARARNVAKYLDRFDDELERLNAMRGKP
jgi:hypothetical protein